MANTILTSLTGLSTPASADSLYIVDSSDTTDGASGTSKKITYANIAGSMLAEMGVTASTTELNYTTGVTSAIQTQLGTKAPLASPTFTGTVTVPVALTGILRADSGVVSVDTTALLLAGAQTVTGAKTFTTGLLKAVDITSGAGVSTLPTSTDTLVGRATTDTLTNKRITKRVTTTTDDATAVIDTDSCDEYELSAVANATEFTLTGTPTDGQTLIVRIKDAGASKALTWTGFTAIGVTLPTATTISKWHYVGCKYNSAASAWHVIAVVEEA